jgi:hypothetical protein
MNDLLAPILLLQQNDADAFYCFSHFMNTRMQENFLRDQSGMRNKLKTLGLLIRFMDPYLYAHFEITDNDNMFCCFRWMLVLFKREFSLDSITKLWEVNIFVPNLVRLYFHVHFRSISLSSCMRSLFTL